MPIDKVKMDCWAPQIEALIRCLSQSYDPEIHHLESFRHTVRQAVSPTSYCDPDELPIVNNLVEHYLNLYIPLEDSDA